MPEDAPTKSFSLIHVDAGSFSAPVEKLVDRISDAIGTIFAPTQIRRLASAEADAAQTKAAAYIRINKELQQAEIANTDIEKRAVQRLLSEESKRQANIERVVEKALPQVSDSAKPESVSQDWLTSFFEKARLTSDDEMQALWSAILAGEVNSPGKFTLRSINLVASLDKADAQSFQAVCNFGLSVAGGSMLFPVLDPIEDPIFSANNVSFYATQNLASIGLIVVNHAAGYSAKKVAPDLAFGYFDEHIDIQLPAGETEINLGHILLSDVGQRIASICDRKKVPGYVEYLGKLWAKKGIHIKVTNITDGSAASQAT